MKLVTIALACIVVTVAAGALLASAAYASAHDPDLGGAPLKASLAPATSASASPLLAKELAVLTNQGISPARAMQAIRVQGAIAQTDLPSRLRAAMGRDFAGVWFDSATAQLHVGVTSSAGRRIADMVVGQTGLASDVTITPVRSTMAELLAAQNQWSSRLAGLFPHEEIKTSLEPQHNAVSVTLNPAMPAPRRAALKREVAAAPVNVLMTVAADTRLGAIREAKECNIFNEEKPNADCNPSITAGVEIWSKIDCEEVEIAKKGKEYFKTKNECEKKKEARVGEEGKWKRESTECTAGPAGIPIGNKRKRVLLTAGHCVDGGGEIAEWFAFKRNLEEPLIGKAGSFVNWGKGGEKKGDFGEIAIEAAGGWQTAKPNNPVLAVTAEWKKKEETRYPVKGERDPVAGMTNCHEGATSGEWCGQIKALAAKLKEGELVAEGLVEDEKAISQGGDSGGPWMFIEANNEVRMEGTHVGKEPVKCKENKIEKEGAEFFETQAECLEYTEPANREGKKGLWERKLETYFEPLRQPVPGAGEGSLEFLELDLLTKTNQRIRPEFAAGKYPLTFTTTSGESRLETAGGRLVKCKATKSEGLIGSATELKNTVVKFTGCKGKISTFEAPCKSSGAAAEEIVTNKIKGLPIYINKSKKEAGLLSEPQEAGALYAEFKCENLFTETIKIKGTTLDTLTPVNTSTTLFTLLAKQEKGKPTPSLYENDESEKVKISTLTRGEGLEAFGYEESGREGTQIITTAGAVEVEA
jgi:hypothetical protein